MLGPALTKLIQFEGPVKGNPDDEEQIKQTRYIWVPSLARLEARQTDLLYTPRVISLSWFYLECRHLNLIEGFLTVQTAPGK